MTPTYDIEPRCAADWNDLDPDAQRAFLAALAKLIADLSSGDVLRAGLRVKWVRGTNDVWEMTYASNGRATFQYGEERHPGDPHIIWRRVGTHKVFDQP
jgi:hypothetical protein